MSEIVVRADEVHVLTDVRPIRWPAPLPEQRVAHFLPPIADVEAAPWARSLTMSWHCIPAGG